MEYDNSLILKHHLPAAELEKAFDAIPLEKRKERLKSVVEALEGGLQMATNPNDILNALISDEGLRKLTEYPQVYTTSHQLPFSKNTLYMRTLKGGVLEWSFDNDRWVKHTGDYDLILRSRFKSDSPFHNQMNVFFLDKVFEEHYRNAIWYFDNINKAPTNV